MVNNEGIFGWKVGDYVINVNYERVGRIYSDNQDGEYTVEIMDNTNRDWIYKPTGKYEDWNKRNFVAFNPNAPVRKQWKKPNRSYGF